jgi:hypothetical protein
MKPNAAIPPLTSVTASVVKAIVFALSDVQSKVFVIQRVDLKAGNFVMVNHASVGVLTNGEM